ncbi:MAG: biotin/lipoyl-binding protein [Oscillospiraceae bacterium]|nr:biotin/lipoyl-binding protein [Oscillospiraceae bacterium]
MKRFNITVNGKAYDVAVEEVTGGAPVAAAPAPIAAAPVQAAAPAPEAAPASAAPAVTGGTPVNSPMPGTILDVKVNVGDTVAEGQVLMILEAMKMENDIVAPVAGKVAAINVKKGDTVNSNDALASIQ